MLSLVPKLHELIGTAASRTIAQLRELGVEPSARRSATITVTIAPFPSLGQQLMATTLIDMLLRLDPLVGQVIVDAPGWTNASSRPTCRQAAAGGRKRQRAGRTTRSGSAPPPAERISPPTPRAGWPPSARPQAPATTAIRSGRWRARRSPRPKRSSGRSGPSIPNGRALLEMTPWRGAFSFFSYGLDRVSPPIRDIRIAATLVGAGGVGAGFIRAVAALGDRVSGSLDLIDADILTTDNLNRVSYATLAGTLAGTQKVIEAEGLVRRCCPDLAVTGSPGDLRHLQAADTATRGPRVRRHGHRPR